ncbi:complement C3 isoform X2 [Lates calcarifer]|uniref:Complement C3 isoform X2 n=1 Tax=Lates calcarifer TaxID=8187 RepID=A0AAJ7LQP7_LATCA|nr:complement C3 isoform X2 [Lates calcarifer]
MGQWTLHNILFLLLLCNYIGESDSLRRFTLLAPDLLRTENQENIYLQADGLSSPITVSISIRDYRKTTTLLQDSVILNPENGFHALKAIQLPSDRLNREETRNKFVFLKVDFGGLHSEERVLMVSFHSGHIFIQTDKPIYKPGDTVRFRAFMSSPSFKALDSSVTIDIQNPDGVVVKQISRRRAADGVVTDTFPLSEMVNEGTWMMTAKFDHWKQNTFTSQFEVKKYVLPAFNVTLTLRKSYLDVEDRELVVEISARYLYREPVQGTAYVVFGVNINKMMRRLPVVHVSNLVDGVAVVRLSMEEIKRVYPNIRDFWGDSVYVKASVLTKSGGDLVEAILTGIKVVKSPYVVSFKDIPKYFKPGLPFEFTVQVSHHDGSPANNVLVKLNLLETPLVVNSGTARATVNMPNDQRPQTIIAEIMQDGLRPEQQVKTHTFVEPYETFNQDRRNYLHISAGTNAVSVGDGLSVKLTIKTADQTQRDLIKHITYLVINKGKIISAERLDVTGQLLTGIPLTVTPDMMPSFRFVAYYSIPGSSPEEVVSDSIWVDVADSCVGGLKVGPVDGIHRDYTPGRSFRFQVRGDLGAKVSLVGVDSAVYLLNKDRLTQKKIWDVVEHGDIGCTHGGGRDARKVFTDAGLLFTSSANFQTPTRQTLECPGGARRRRSAELLRRKAQLESHYKESLQRRCCKDGLRNIPMPYSCTQRSLYITEGWECIRAFLHCCATYRGPVFNTEIPTTPPPTTTTPPTTTPPPPTIKTVHGTFIVEALMPHKPRGEAGYAGVDENKLEEEWAYPDDTEYLRSKFYESWLWMDVNLPSKADRDGLASKNVDDTLPDSITEWGVLAISSSPHTGFCVAEPYKFRAWKRFFVDLKLPYSVARNEQVEIKAVIHNYDYEDLHVRVILMKTEGMCSIAFKSRHMQEVTLAVGSSVAVPYTIVPLVVGKLPLEVMVIARDMMGRDRIQKSLWVVMDGVQKKEVRSVVLNPSAAGGTQTIHLAPCPLESVVPNSVPETFINIRGNVLADSIDNSISDDSLASLIQMPGGCVEQNLARITLPLIATLYLDRTNSWEKVGVQRKVEAIQYIRRGYENQLAYRKSDGSYPPYRNQGSSTWITAYTVKVFSMAYSIISIDEQQVCDPLRYLVKNTHQFPPGKFIEDTLVYDTTLTGGLRGDDPEITLTAFVLIALGEAKHAGIHCTHPDVNMELVIDKTANYLKSALATSGRRPYTVAITSYALALLGKAQPNEVTQSLLGVAAQDGSHWPDSHNTLFTLEATGYALLALVTMGRMEEAEAPFKWLNSQRRQGGGYGSTQSTMVVLQALSGYLINKPLPDDFSLDVDISLAGRKEISYHFTPSTAYAARSSRLSANPDVEVEARGNGQGIVEVVTYYNQVHEVDEKKPCEHFKLNVTIEESSEQPPADEGKSYQINIQVKALGSRDVRMVVLDISLPTGFTPDTSDLEMLLNSVDRYIDNYQIVDNLSDRGSLIIHLFKVSHTQPVILIFRLKQSFKVGLLQPSSVTVYEYYNPDHRCSRTYTPSQDKEELSRICRDNVCRCTQGDCCVSKTDSEDFPNKEREKFACKSLHHVFKVKVLSVSQSYYDKYEMEITQVIKLGEEAGVEVGQKRFFMSHGGCRERLNLEQGSQYLIIGPKEDQWNIDSETNRFVYMLGKDTWVERWPSSAECSSNPSLQAKCRSLDEAASHLSLSGCTGV